MQSEALELLEWPRLCQHVATFAATKLGKHAALHPELPATRDRSLELLRQTQEAWDLDTRIPGGLSFEGICDITEALRRASKHGLLSGIELWQIATTLAGARTLRRTLDGAERCPTLQAIAANLRTHPDLEQDIYHCIDEGGTVLDRASEGLAGVRSSLRQVRDRLLERLQEIAQNQGAALQDRTITQRGDRYVLAVKAPQKDRIPGIIHDVSGSGMTLYVEPHAIVASGNRLRQLAEREREEIERVLRHLSDRVEAVCDDLLQLLAAVTAIDLATARARYGGWLRAHPPQWDDLACTPGEARGAIHLRQLRHPLLVWQQQYEQGAAVVPVDVTIAPQVAVVAITGPNTGGKTATLKALGLAALMAKAGMFVPAADPVVLPWFDVVLADIGDEQSLQQSLSTFSGHVRRIARILDTLSDRSLVLLDEVGAGTDPTEGSALAAALLEYLAGRAALTVATTHYGELKALKYRDPRFENASVEFDDMRLAPTYRLLWGIPGRSNALAIAGRLGLSAEVIAAARDRVGLGSAELNAVIADLEAQRRRYSEKLEAVTVLLADTERLHAEIADKSAQLRSQYEELRAAQAKAVADAIQQARKEVARLIRKLQRGEESHETARFGEQRLAELTARHLPVAAVPEPPAPYAPKAGDRVRIKSLGKTGQILVEPSAGGDVTVRLGQLKMTVKLADIEPVSP